MAFCKVRVYDHGLFLLEILPESGYLVAGTVAVFQFRLVVETVIQNQTLQQVQTDVIFVLIWILNQLKVIFIATIIVTIMFILAQASYKNSRSSAPFIYIKVKVRLILPFIMTFVIICFDYSTKRQYINKLNQLRRVTYKNQLE